MCIYIAFSSQYCPSGGGDINGLYKELHVSNHPSRNVALCILGGDLEIGSKFHKSWRCKECKTWNGGDHKSYNH